MSAECFFSTSELDYEAQTSNNVKISKENAIKYTKRIYSEEYDSQYRITSIMQVNVLYDNATLKKYGYFKRLSSTYTLSKCNWAHPFFWAVLHSKLHYYFISMPLAKNVFVYNINVDFFKYINIFL